MVLRVMNGKAWGGDILKPHSDCFEENRMGWANRKQKKHKKLFTEVHEREQMMVLARV